MDKQISIDEAVAKIKDGMTLMIGGFLANGTPEKIIDALVKANVKNLTIIANDTGFPDKGIGKLVVNHQVKKIVTSHVGTNPETGNQMNAGLMEVEFSPQGTLAERVRAGGAGIGGFLTPTGLGTQVAEGKEIIERHGKQYLFEEPLRADVALLKANVSDHLGNLIYKGTTQNFNPLMATAADIVIVEVEELVETGKLPIEAIHTPHIFVDYIVQ
ncbi:MAG: CoA transferase subunit A [Bacteroidales bacterium]|jgi:acetate CoA/acetoacetate CoA-transferase alpha subunit|nr:CoA transferase subunit A [Bacteroidales bacterium]